MYIVQYMMGIVDCINITYIQYTYKYMLFYTDTRTLNYEIHNMYIYIILYIFKYKKIVK